MPPGRVVGLVGPNGAGKTTLLQWIESGIFLGLAAVLAGVCFYRLRRRMA